MTPVPSVTATTWAPTSSVRPSAAGGGPGVGRDGDMGGHRGLGLSLLSSPMSPGAEDLECGSSLGELEAIREPLVEEKEDEDGAAEPEER